MKRIINKINDELILYLELSIYPTNWFYSVIGIVEEMKDINGI